MKALYLILAGVAVFAFDPAHAEQRPIGAGIAPLYARWQATKAECDRPGPWTRVKNASCNRWYAATDDMARHGWCYGGTASREPWHICNADDRRAQEQADASMAANAEQDRIEAIAIRSMSPADQALYRRWVALVSPCENGVVGSDCRAVGRIARALNQHGWCRYSPIGRAQEYWHRCRPGDPS